MHILVQLEPKLPGDEVTHQDYQDTQKDPVDIVAYGLQNLEDSLVGKVGLKEFR